MRIRHRRALAALSVSMMTGIAACGRDGSSSADSVEVVDSAGVRVVRNSGPSWAAGEAWLVDAEPEWLRGELEGPAETRFFQIRDVALRGDGSVVVADGGSAEIRAFGADGEHLWTQGGEGDGPGEYRAPSRLLVLAGDSVAVYDGESRRVTVVGPGGAVARSFVPEVPDGASMAAPDVVVTPDRWVSRGGVRFSGDVPPSGTIAPPMPYFWSGPDGTALDSVTSLPTGARLIQQSGSGIGVWTVPFSLDGQLAGGGGRLITAAPTAPLWTARDSTGRVVQVVSFPAEARPVGNDAWEAALAAAIPEDADARRRQAVTEAYAAMERPEEQPVIQELIVDDEGHVWLEGFRPPGAEAEPSRWWVFDEAGRLLGRVSLPTGLEVQAIGGDRIVGVARDELEVERIQVHRLRRPS